MPRNAVFKLLILFAMLMVSIPVFAGDLTIKSNPIEAEVFVRNPAENEEHFLGKTSYKIKLDELVNNYTKSSSFVLTIKKDGFDSYRVLAAKTGNNDIVLNVNLDISKNIKMTKRIDKLVTELFDIQRLVRAKNYDDAIKNVDKLEKDYSQFSTVYEIKAGALYLKKNYKQALSFYRKAFNINPDNLDAYRMKTYLEKHFASKGKIK